MKHHSLIVASILALSVSGFAMAQDQTTPQPTIEQPSKTEPVTPETTMPDTNVQKPALPAESTDAAQNPVPDTSTSTAEVPAAATTDVIVSESAFNSIQPWTANEFIGKTVYSSNNENVGEINDLVFGNDGKIIGVVVGVGGFLGIGEKDVLVSLDSIKMIKPDGSDSVQLTVSASKEALENAPGFDRVAKRFVPIETAPAAEAPAVQPEPATPTPTPTEPQTQTQ